MHESELTLLLEGTGDAALAVDLRGQIRTWNKAAGRMFGCDASATLGRTCAAVINGHNVSGAQVCKQDCFTLECARGLGSTGPRGTVPLARSGIRLSNFDMEARPKGVRPFWVNVSVLIASDVHTDRRLVVHLIRDITDRKRVEDFAAGVLRLEGRLRQRGKKRDGQQPATPSLTVQERRVLELIRDGNGTGEIARKLQVKPATLRNHIHHVNQKLGTRSRIEAVMQAVKRGVI